MNTKHALILVDIQNDFLPGGPLPVPYGNDVIPPINQLMMQFSTVVATQDWHPANHRSFASNHPGKSPYEIIDLHGLPQTLWPDHCIQGTYGAAFSSELNLSLIHHIVQKGTHTEVDSYSGFQDNGHTHQTGLENWLKYRELTHLTICGLATDYCVKFTVLDALNAGFHVTLHLPACRGVNLNPDDVEQAIQEMQQAGAIIQP